MKMMAIDLAKGQTIIRQVYEHIRNQIISGKLKEGERLPSTRQLATTLQVSRNVVLESYDLLKAEGFLESKQGAGTYIANGTYLEQVDQRLPNTGPLAQASSNMPSSESSPEPLNGLSISNTTEQAIDPLTSQASCINFRYGLPALDHFPRKLWGRIYEQTCRDTPAGFLGYDRPEGRYELRALLAEYLRINRGAVCTAEQIVITSGATQALTLAAKLFLISGSKVLLEDPITPEIHAIFGQPGVELIPIDVDDNGMITESIPQEERPSMIYVTPSHQFPTGGVLPIRRRLDLIRLARASDGYIVEDDYDSEFRFEGPPISSMQGLDPDRVLYIGTFSKLLLPSLRLGYMILPPSLIERGRNLKWLSDLHVPSLDQLVMAQFIRSGHLERHITGMRKLYRTRRNRLLQALTLNFGDRVTIRGHTTGLHLVAAFEGAHFTEELVASILESGVRVYPLETHALRKGHHTNELILGYGNVSEEQITEGISRLHEVLSSNIREAIVAG